LQQLAEILGMRRLNVQNGVGLITAKYAVAQVGVIGAGGQGTVGVKTEVPG